MLVLVSRPTLLTVTPPVYHDEYVLLSPAVALLDGHGLSVAPFASTPALSATFGGEGRFVPGLTAGFYSALGAWFAAVGVGIHQARLFVFLLGALVVALVFALGARWSGIWVGAAAALLMALDGTFWLGSRQVRPETFTVAAYLTGALLVSIRDERWRMRLAVAAGVAIGLGIAGHPVGAAVVAVILGLPFASWGRMPPRPYVMRLGLAVAVVALAYVAFLVWHREGVAATLELHRAQRPVESIDLGARLIREGERYMVAYLNSYTLALGLPLRRAAFAGWGLLVLACLVKLSRAPHRVPVSLAALAGAPALVMAAMAVLARDRNLLYLMHVLPWLYLAGATGVATAADMLLRSAPARRAVAVAAWALLAVLAGAGVRHYAREAAPYGETRVLRYEELERLLVAHMPRGAFVIANPAAWLATRAAGAEFVFNRQYVQLLPSYRRYPVRAAFESGSHLVDYELDIALLEQMRASGRGVFYLVDMWDWSWNVHAPFGRYAESFRSLRMQLERFFSPVVVVYTRDRGLVSLHRFDGAEPRSRVEPPFYLEDEPRRRGRDIAPPVNPPFEVALPAGRPTPIATLPVTPGAAYLLHLELRVLEGRTVMPVSNGATLPKWVDAKVAVPVDSVIHATAPVAQLALWPHSLPATAVVERISLVELGPPPSSSPPASGAAGPRRRTP